MHLYKALQAVNGRGIMEPAPSSVAGLDTPLSSIQAKGLSSQLVKLRVSEEKNTGEGPVEPG